MSVYIDKKDGVVTGIHIFNEDVKLLGRSLEALIDHAQEFGAVLNMDKFKHDELNKALFNILREF